MKKTENVILISVLVLVVGLFVLYELGYIRIYLSKDSVYSEITEINEDYLLLKSLKKSGGLLKNQEVELSINGDINLIKKIEVGQRIKFTPTKIEETNPVKVYTDSVEIIK